MRDISAIHKSNNNVKDLLFLKMEVGSKYRFQTCVGTSGIVVWRSNSFFSVFSEKEIHKISSLLIGSLLPETRQN